MIKAKIITSLEKVFPEGMQEGYEIKEIKGCLGETVSFQIAYHWQEPMKAYGKVQMEGSKEILDRTTVRQVELVPSQYPWAIDGDDGYIKKNRGCIRIFFVTCQIWVLCWFQTSGEVSGSP